MTASLEKFGETESPGQFLLLDDGEYLQAEQDSQRVTLIWTTFMAADQVVEALLRAAGDPPDGTNGLLCLATRKPDGSELAEGTSSDICEYVRKDAFSIALFNVDFGDFVFAWRAPIKKLKDFKEPLAECGISVTTGSYQVIEDLVSETGTPGIHANASSLLSRLDLLNRLR